MIISESKQENYCTEISNGNSIIFSDVTEEKGGEMENIGVPDTENIGG